MDMSGQGLTFMIGHTAYSDEDESCAIQAGPPPEFIFALTSPGILLPDDPNAKLLAEEEEKKNKKRNRRNRRRNRQTNYL